MRKDRLLKLADFLDKLPRKKFDFGCVINGPSPTRKTMDCGSVACGIGWTPAVFPRLVEGYKIAKEEDGLQHWDVRVKANPRKFNTYFKTAAHLFGLDNDTAYALFTPGQQHRIGEGDLFCDSKPQDLSGLIRRFVKKNSKPRN